MPALLPGRPAGEPHDRLTTLPVRRLGAPAGVGLLGAALWAGCSEEFPAQDSQRALISIHVEPGTAAASTGPDGGAPVQFEAKATLDDGSILRLDVAEWTLSNNSTGSIDETGYFVPSVENGGVTYVRARLNNVEGESTLTVKYEEEWVEPGTDPSLFQGEPQDASLWLYPEDGVNLPRNTPSIEFQWTGANLVEPVVAWYLRFQSETMDLRVYTTGTSWIADEATWQEIASTNAGGTVKVGLFAATDTGVWGGPQRTIHINRMDGRGSIYYWSSSAAGVKRLPYGGLAEDYYTSATSGYCVACHVVSSQGRMAFTYDGGNGPLGLYDMDSGATVVGHDAGVLGNFKAFSPDGSRLLTTYNGALLLYDGLTGALISEVATGGTATHVDWSPDGGAVALTLTTEHALDWSSTGDRIAVMDYLGDDQFGAPVTLYTPPAGMNAYYPAWSPDGAWIAFNTSTGDTYDDEDAALHVLSADGAVMIPLEAANQVGGITNSWPKWGPLPDDDILWLAFSSKRAYGGVIVGIPQVWVAAFDPARAEAGADPSFPAFWLPNQDPAQNNHIPVWAEE